MRPLQCASLGVMGYSLFVPEGLSGVGNGALDKVSKVFAQVFRV